MLFFVNYFAPEAVRHSELEHLVQGSITCDFSECSRGLFVLLKIRQHLQSGSEMPSCKALRNAVLAIPGVGSQLVTGKKWIEKSPEVGGCLIKHQKGCCLTCSIKMKKHAQASSKSEKVAE